MTDQTYILYSTKLDRFYIGSSNQVSKRLLQHNNKESKYTALGVPWSLVWCADKTDREKAEKLETKLKNLSRARKIRFMEKYFSGIVDHNLLKKIKSKL